MIVIRNRLAALFFRIASFAALLWALLAYWPLAGYEYAPICLLEIQTGIAYLLLLFFVVIFNAIDLRHGVSGIAAGAYQPLSLALVSFTSIAGTLSLCYSLPLHRLWSAQSVVYASLLIFLPLVEWILFAPKGGVKSYHGITWLVYPLFFVVFSILRTVIWPDHPLFIDGADFQFLFFDFHEDLFWLWSSLSVIAVYLWSLLLIFVDRLLGRKFRKRKGVLYEG